MVVGENERMRLNARRHRCIRIQPPLRLQQILMPSSTRTEPWNKMEMVNAHSHTHACGMGIGIKHMRTLGKCLRAPNDEVTCNVHFAYIHQHFMVNDIIARCRQQVNTENGEKKSTKWAIINWVEAKHSRTTSQSSDVGHQIGRRPTEYDPQWTESLNRTPFD